MLVAATLQLGESDGVQWAEEVLGGPEGAAASLAACPVLLAEYREFSGRSEVRGAPAGSCSFLHSPAHHRSDAIAISSIAG